MLADDSEEQNETPLPDLPAVATFTDPFQIVEGVIHIQMTFPRAGMYHCELYAGEDQEVLMSRRIIVAVEGPATGEV
jgi:hypothetical protein